MGLLDIVGSFAGAGASILSRQNKEAEDLETRKQIADHQAKLEAQKLDTIERLKEARAKREQSEFIDASVKADERSQALGEQRRFESFKKKVGPTDATDDELREGFKSYDNTAVQVDGKTDSQFVDRRTDAAGDYVKAARETGNTGLLSTAMKGVDDARAADVAESKEKYANRKAEETERKNLETERQRDERDAKRDERDNRRLDIYASKGHGGSSSGNGRTDPTYRLALTTQLNAANKDVTELRKTLDAFDANMLNKTSQDPAVIQKRTDLKQELSDAVETKKMLLDQFKTLGEDHSGSESPKRSGSKPSGGQSDRLSQFKVIR